MSNTPEDIEQDTSSSEEDEDDGQDDAPPVESLVTGREKRATAGQRMSALINQEVDDDLELLFAEVDEEDVDFEDLNPAGTFDAEVAEEDDDSSSSEESEGEGDEFEGEKRLNKEEQASKRAEKRKAHKALGRPAATRPKKVRIAKEMISVEVMEAASSPQGLIDLSKRGKRSERTTWMPTAEEAPTRTSSRTLSVQNKEKTMATMKEMEDRRFRQIAVMEAAQKRKGREKAQPMTQAERLAEAVKTERINKKSLNKWEQTEIERQEKQRAKLEALQNRTLAGPVITWYSGPAQWINGKLAHVGKRPRVEEVIEERVVAETCSDEEALIVAPPIPGNGDIQRVVTDGPPADLGASGQISLQPLQSDQKSDQAVHEAIPAATEMTDTALDQQTELDKSKLIEITSQSVDLLAGIQYYASLPENGNAAEATHSSSPSTRQAHLIPTSVSPGTPIVPTNRDELSIAESTRSCATTTSQAAPPDSTETDLLKTTNAPGSTMAVASAQLQTPQSADPIDIPRAPTPPPPLIEYSTRNLVTLENFDPTALRDRDIYRRIVFGTFSTKPTKTPQTACAITSAPARYRDPKTGLPYAGLEAYRCIQKLASGGAAWSSLLGAWVGSADEGSLGGDVCKVKEVEKGVGARVHANVKMEGE